MRHIFIPRLLILEPPRVARHVLLEFLRDGQFFVKRCKLFQPRRPARTRRDFGFVVEKTVAIILYLLVGAGALGTWCTIVMDQYFTSPTLLLVLTYLKVFCIGTCQTNRRGWPATQIAETEASIGKVSKPGDVVFKHEVAGLLASMLFECRLQRATV